MKAKLERLVGRIEGKHKELARCVSLLFSSLFTLCLRDWLYILYIVCCRPPHHLSHRCVYVQQQKHTACVRVCGTLAAAAAPALVGVVEVEAGRSWRPCSCPSRYVCMFFDGSGVCVEVEVESSPIVCSPVLLCVYTTQQKQLEHAMDLYDGYHRTLKQQQQQAQSKVWTASHPSLLLSLRTIINSLPPVHLTHTRQASSRAPTPSSASISADDEEEGSVAGMSRGGGSVEISLGGSKRGGESSSPSSVEEGEGPERKRARRQG